MKRIQLAIVAATIAFSSIAFAGYSASQGVIVYPAQAPGQTSEALGSVYGARHSSDTSEWIGCYVMAYAGSSPVGYCLATDASGHTANCTTTDGNQILAIESLTDYSWLHFQSDGSAHCSLVQVDNLSYEMP
jgi:hypothetical protein